MPYIHQQQRKLYDKLINDLVYEINYNVKNDVDLAGVWNYIITSLILRTIKYKYGKIRYWMNAFVKGVMIDITDEFHRKLTGSYENIKIDENGDLSEWNDLLPEKKK